MEQDKIIKLLCSYLERTGKYPTCKLSYSELGTTSKTIRKHFGSFSAAYEAAGFPARNKRIETRCAQCEKMLNLIPSAITENNFCNSSCASTFNNSRRIVNYETKQKISASLKRKGVVPPQKPPSTRIAWCSQCSRYFPLSKNQSRHTKSCSQECKNKNQAEWLSENRSHIIGRNGPSYMESSFAKWLTKNGIEPGYNGFLTEIKFRNKASGKYGWIDFVFPRKRLIIELDGTHHKNRLELDAERDAYLKTRGWEVVRISHREYIKKSRLSEILDLLF